MKRSSKRATHVINGVTYFPNSNVGDRLLLAYERPGKPPVMFWYDTRTGLRVRRLRDSSFVATTAKVPGQPKGAAGGPRSELVAVAQVILDEVAPMTLGQLGKAFTAPDVQKALGLARNHLGRATGLMMKRLFSKTFVARITALANEAFVAGASVGSGPATKRAPKTR